MEKRRAGVALAAIAGALALPTAAQAAPLYADAVLDDGPLTYLRLSETTGTVAQDASPHDRDGSFVGAPSLGVVGPFLDAGTAVGLAKTDTITAAVDASSSTVELWVRPSRLARGQQAGIVAHGDPSGDGWALGIGTKRKLAFKTGGVVLTSKVSLPADAWTQLDVTFTDKKVLIYRNGALAKSLNRNGATPTSSNGALVVGGNGAGAFTGAYAGRVDEVAVFPQVLSGSDIQQHFTSAHVPTNTAPPSIERRRHGRLDSDRARRSVDRRRDGDLQVAALRRGRRRLRGHHGRDRHDVRRRRRGRMRHAPGRRDDADPRGRGHGRVRSHEQGAGRVRPGDRDRRWRHGRWRDRDRHRHRDWHWHRDWHRDWHRHRHEDRHGARSRAGRSGRGAELPAGRLGPPSHADPPRRRRPRRSPASGCLATPLRASVRARKGVKLRSVRYRLDGKRLARAKKPRFRVRLAPAALGAGTHKLVVKVRPRGGKPRRAVIRLRVAAG